MAGFLGIWYSVVAVFLSCYLGLGQFFVSFMELFPPYGVWVLSIISGSAMFLWLLMVWDCSGQVGVRLWCYFARLFVMAGALSMVFYFMLLSRFQLAIWLWYRIAAWVVGG